MRKDAVLNSALAIAVACLFVACSEDSPNKPSPVASASVESIQVVGPDQVSWGASVQFVAQLRLSDGTTKSASSMPNLRWTTSDTSMMGVSSSGVSTFPDLTTGEMETFGDVVITAQLTNGLQGSLVVSVQPSPLGSAEPVSRR